jgi:hypothetical protein
MIRRYGFYGLLCALCLTVWVGWLGPSFVTSLADSASEALAADPSPTATPDLLWLLLHAVQHCEEFPGYFDAQDVYHTGWDCRYLTPTLEPSPTLPGPPSATPIASPATTTPTQEATELPTGTPVPSRTPTPTAPPDPDRFVVLRIVSAPDKNVRALCSLKGGILGTWPVGEARAVFSFEEADGFIWANQGYAGTSTRCSAVGYRSSSGVVWWVRVVSGDLLSLPGWPADLDTNAELPAIDRTFDTTEVGVALHLLPGADYLAIYRHADKWAGSVTFDLNWGAGAWLKALNPEAENICRTTRYGDVPDIHNLDGWYQQQIQTMPSLASGVCDVYQIGNEYSQWFTTEQWVSMNIRFIELAEQEGLGRRLGLGATGPGHLPVAAKDEVQFRRLLERMIRSPISHVLILHQSGYCQDCGDLPYVNDPWVAGSDDKAFNDLLNGDYNNLLDVRVAELGLGDGYAGGSGGPSDCAVIANAIAYTRDILRAPQRQVRVISIWNFGGEELGWVNYNRCIDQIAAAL